MCLHAVCALTIVAMPRFLRSDQSSSSAGVAKNTRTDVQTKEIPAPETLPPNCDSIIKQTTWRAAPTPFGNRHKTIEFAQPAVLVRSHSTAATNDDRNRSLFVTDSDMMRFNGRLVRNGGGALHQRITAGAYMQHVDAKF